MNHRSSAPDGHSHYKPAGPKCPWPAIHPGPPFSRPPCPYRPLPRRHPHPKFPLWSVQTSFRLVKLASGMRRGPVTERRAPRVPGRLPPSGQPARARSLPWGAPSLTGWAFGEGSLHPLPGNARPSQCEVASPQSPKRIPAAPKSPSPEPQQGTGYLPLPSTIRSEAGGPGTPQRPARPLSLPPRAPVSPRTQSTAGACRGALVPRAVVDVTYVALAPPSGARLSAAARRRPGSCPCRALKTLT